MVIGVRFNLLQPLIRLVPRGQFEFYFKAHSYDVHLMCEALADGCITTKKENFLIFHTAPFCHTHMHQMHVVWMSHKVGEVYKKT